MPGVSGHPQSSNPPIVRLSIGDWPDSDLFPVALTGLPGDADGSRERSPDADVLHLVSQNIGRVVLLVDEHELDARGLRGLPAILRGVGMELVWRPISSRPAPELLYEICGWVRDPPYRASMALMAVSTKGRAAMVAACAIDEDGVGVEKCMDIVRQYAGADALRPKYRRGILAYARYWRSLPPTEGTVLRGIRNRDLRGCMLPPQYAPWFPDINAIALTFNAYERIGTLEVLNSIVTTLHREFGKHGSLRPGHTLSELRGALFALQRGYHHEGDGPEPHDMPFIWSLIDAIRKAARS